MNKKVYPLFSHVKTENLNHLHECENIVDVIGFETAKRIAGSVAYAKKKHPHFADKMTDGTLENCRASLKSFQHENDIGETCGDSVADDILNEEYLEAMEQHLLGNKEKCIEELCHTAAVIIRMIEMERAL